MKKWLIFRRAVQGLFLLLFVYILWSTTYPLEGLLPADTFFKADPLIMFITSFSERVLLPGLLFSVFMVILTLVFGRFFCGWICPLGTCIDTAGALRKRNSTLKDRTNQRLSLPKFIILGVIMLFALLGIQLAWVFDPIVIMGRFVSLNLIPTITLGIDKGFVFFIQKFEFYGKLYDIYREMKSSVLGINVYYFSHSLIIFVFFFLIMVASLFVKRAWCRICCPLGAFYAFVSKFSLLRRNVEECTFCMKCKSLCRMGAIKSNMRYEKGECILCMDCIYDCPQNVTRFGWGPSTRSVRSGQEKKEDKNGMSRRSFIFVLLASFVYLVGFKKKETGGEVSSENGLIRPPGALKEKDFIDRCIRCGNCMKVCITNGLQPVLLQSGLLGIWTPQLIPEIGYCEHQCTLCGHVCPTGAIPKLDSQEKMKVRLGIAKVNRSICIPWSIGMACIVCEEHCPIPDKAIKLVREERNGEILLKPYVDRSLCIGCGICQNVCPARPERAIKVNPKFADRK